MALPATPVSNTQTGVAVTSSSAVVGNNAAVERLMQEAGVAARAAKHRVRGKRPCEGVAVLAPAARVTHKRQPAKRPAAAKGAAVVAPKRARALGGSKCQWCSGGCAQCLEAVSASMTISG